MATKKKLLQAAAGTAAASGGAGALNVEDVFSTYLYEGNEGVNAIENGINLGQSNDGGSAKFSGASTSSYIEVPNSTDFTLGSYYSLEANIWLETTTGSQTIFGRWYATNNNENYVFYVGSGGTVTGGVYPAYSQLQSVTGLQSGRWYHLLFSFDGSSLRLFIDGTLDQTVSSNQHYVTGTGSTPFSIGGNSDGGANFKGNISNVRVRKFTQSSQVPTSNFTAPTSPLTADAYTVLLTCQGDDAFTDNSASSHTVSAVSSSDVTQSAFGPFDAADAGEGGLVWIKDRTDGFSNVLFDTERGFGNYLVSNTTFAQNGSGDLGWSAGSFNSNGFTTVQGTNGTINGSGTDFASWTFRKAPKFFTCVTYSGTGSAQNISHDLDAEVGFMIVKRTDSTSTWRCWHRGLPSGNNVIHINETGAYETNSDIWNGTAPTSTQFSVGTNANVNASGGTYVAYLFAHNDGDGDFGPTGDQDIIKCGSYTTDGSGGVSVDLGFEPQWIMYKPTSTTGPWVIVDSMRGWTANSESRTLTAESSGAEQSVVNLSSSYPLNRRSDGFDTSNALYASQTYIYIAIRRGPMAVPTDATDVFGATNANEPSTSELTTQSGVLTDMVLHKPRIASAGEPFMIVDRIRGKNKLLQTTSTAAELDSQSLVTLDFWQLDNNENAYIDASQYYNNSGGAGQEQINYSWKRAPSFCDVVAYTGNGTAGRTVSHGLTVPPEMIWVKQRNATRDWSVFHTGIGNTDRLKLNLTDAATANNNWNNTDPTDTVFTLSHGAAVNGAGNTYIAYLFASLDGVSKVGSFTHTNGTATNVDCGFSNGARFVLLKYYDQISDWWVFDTERGIAAGNDARLILNNTNAETSTDQIDPYSAGFTYDAARASGDIIFYAIA